MGFEYTEISQTCRTRERREQLHVSNREDAIGSISTVSSLINMFLCVNDAILFKELDHVWGNCREVNDLVAGNPRPESWCAICRFGLKGNKSHKSSFLRIVTPCSNGFVVLIIR